ncbi:hypothetical protein ACOCJ7_15430 [Knoellia sp. CPCC 206453]|uniref:hypothetical protein n=1 Tax=Knoellia pratensis TaxID=3404796 RepID=UPI00361D3B5B
MKRFVAIASAATALAAVVAAPNAQAVTEYSWSQSASGVTVSGVWYKDTNGYIVLKGTVKDTAGDSSSAVAQIHFTEDCCSNRVEADGGVGTSTSFTFRSGTRAPSNFRTKVGLERYGYTSYGSWKSYTTW